MIEQVATTITSKGMPRNEGLRAILDYFNSFESHDRFYFGPEQPAEEGIGVQLVIVWDAHLDGRPVAQTVIPKSLLDLATLYDTTHIPDLEQRIRMKDGLVEAMEALLDREVSRQAVASEAKARESNGLIAALGDAASRAPVSGDGALLVDLIPFATWKHAIKRVVQTLINLTEKGNLDAEVMNALMKLLPEHPLASEPHVHSLIDHLPCLSIISLALERKSSS